jgi:hypothetical protein
LASIGTKVATTKIVPVDSAAVRTPIGIGGGGFHAPATPPGMRIRTGRFERSREELR